MNRDDALKKIKKCLALGRSAEPHEAAAAMRQAQKLMDEYRVSERELQLVDAREARAPARSPAINAWENMLVALVCDAFGCEHFSQATSRYNEAGNWERKRTHVFVGLDATPEVAAYAFDVLARQCAKARLAHIGKQPRNCKPITKTARGDAFAKGWVYGASEKVHAFSQPEETKALLLTYLQEKHPELKKVKPRDTTSKRRQDYGHVAAGVRAGSLAELNRGVGGVEPRGLLA